MLASGIEVGGYRIEGVLGRGGMGIVYEATQVSLGRIIALKILAADISSDETFRDRFRREGRIQASLDHPHIVPVYEAGDLGEYGLFLAMRIVRGPNLKQLIRDGDLPPARALRILAAVADALDSAHEAQLVHRDIKPQNILIGRRDHPYLADFGLTRGPGDTAFTRTGHFVGTIDYIAPEQIEGETPTSASDVYALAAVAFECLTGIVPFPKPTEASILYAHMSQPPPRASEVRDELGADIDDALIRGLSKTPGERQRSALELIRDLERALGAGGVALPAPAPAAERDIVVPTEPIVEPNDGAGAPPAPRGGSTVLSSGPPAPPSSTAKSERRREPDAAPPPSPARAPAETATTMPIAGEPETPDRIPPAAHALPAAPATEEPAAHERSDDATVVAASGADAPGGETVAASRKGARADRRRAMPERDEGVAPARSRTAEAWDPTSRKPAPSTARAPRRVAAGLVVSAALTLVAAAAVAGALTAPESEDSSAARLRAGALLATAPDGWARVDPPAVEGLPLDPVAAASPPGSGSGSLLIGMTDATGQFLLPTTFLERLSELPKPGDRVSLGDGLEAIRYTGLRARGTTAPMTLIVAPATTGVATLVCRGSDDVRAACEGAAGDIELTGDLEPVPLGPRVAYAEAVTRAVSRLRRDRARAARRWRDARTRGGQGRAAAAMADAFDAAPNALEKLDPTRVEVDAHDTLLRYLRRAARDYRSVARAARSGDSARYDRMRHAARRSEDGVGRALTDLGRLGYAVG